MRIADRLLLMLVNIWPSPVKERESTLGDPSTEQYRLDYAVKYQYDVKFRFGFDLDIRDKEILEVGCGHGGITCFLAVNGAKRVVGIDINERNLETAEKLKIQIEKNFGNAIIPVRFDIADATRTSYPDESFDIIVADNVFEHFSEPEAVLKECYRLLRKGGIVSVPNLPSFYGKYGLHLKIGFKLPWANLLFSERTICNVMSILAERDPKLLHVYPGIKNKPSRVRDLRAYKDLNGMTYGRFKRMASHMKFTIKSFKTSPTPRIIGPLVATIPLVNKSILGDIFSSKCTAILLK